MKLKKYNQLFEREGFDDIYDGYDDDDDWSDALDNKGYENDDLTDDQDDDMQHLSSLLREMFTNSGFEAYVEYSGLNIEISLGLSRKESLKFLVKLFELIKKIKKDILIQYESNFEMWETKDGQPCITFSFNFDDTSGYSETPW